MIWHTLVYFKGPSEWLQVRHLTCWPPRAQRGTDCVSSVQRQHLQPPNPLQCLLDVGAHLHNVPAVV